MSHKFVAVFDSSVFYPAPLRDLLLQLATLELFQAKWSEEIESEWVSSLLGDRPDLTLKRLERTKKMAQSAIPDCLINGYQPLVKSLSLPDPGDRHVLAAAIHSKAQVIVTYNLKDFPEHSLTSFGIEAQHPDLFLKRIFVLAPHLFLS